MRILAWYCRRCRRILKTEPKGAYPQGCSCQVPMLPSGPTAVTFSGQVFFHPALLARRAAEIAQSQRRDRLEHDAAGRPFVRAAADPLAEIPAAPAEERGRFEWLIRVLRALGREAGPAMGKPVARPR